MKFSLSKSLCAIFDRLSLCPLWVIPEEEHAAFFCNKKS
jgi:hypothetical protein